MSDQRKKTLPFITALALAMGDLSQYHKSAHMTPKAAKTNRTNKQRARDKIAKTSRRRNRRR